MGVEQSPRLQDGISRNRMYTIEFDGQQRSYNELQMYFLRRGKRLADLRTELRLVDSYNARLKGINKAVYSVYRDCVELGIAEEARKIMNLPEQDKTLTQRR